MLDGDQTHTVKSDEETCGLSPNINNGGCLMSSPKKISPQAYEPETPL